MWSCPAPRTVPRSAASLLRGAGRGQCPGIDALFAQETHHGVGMAMCQQDAAGAGFGECTQQRRPVRMVAECEAAVVATPPAIATHAHPAGAEGAAVFAEAAD